MIAREPRNVRPAHTVQATVPDMREVKLRPYDGQGGTRRSHPMKLRMFLGIALNIFVGRIKSSHQSSLRVIGKTIVVHVAHRLDCETTGFLPTFLATHAISNDRQAALAAKFFIRLGLPIKIGIFIVHALAADIVQAPQFDSWLDILTVQAHSLYA